MADGSVFETPAADGTYFAAIPLLVKKDWLIDLGVPEEMSDAKGLQSLGEELGSMASAALRVALMRGDDPSDMPGTFGDAIEGASTLLQLSRGFAAAAATLAKKEKAHG